MTIIRTAENTRPCSSCANNQSGYCSQYASDVTGGQADIHSARAECKGDSYERRINISAIVEDAPVTDHLGNVYSKDKIVKADGTVVFKEPPAKLYE